jgi:hypothetical protein
VSATLTPAQFANELRRLSEETPKAVERALVDAGMMLEGRLVQKEIAAADPKPVDQGQFKASWQATEIPGGIVVGSTAKHAVVMERGRKPGGRVNLQAIREWVERKGFWKGEWSKRLEAAQHVRKLIDGDGKPSRAVRKERKRAEQDAKAELLNGIALAVAGKIKRDGIAPKWILKRALAALGPRIPSIIRRAIREVGR